MNYYLAKKEVLKLERALTLEKFKEYDALHELIKTQLALANKRFYEADKDIGRAKVELTDLRKKATFEPAEYQEEFLSMAKGSGKGQSLHLFVFSV